MTMSSRRGCVAFVVCARRKKKIYTKKNHESPSKYVLKRVDAGCIIKLYDFDDYFTVVCIFLSLIVRVHFFFQRCAFELLIFQG